MMIPGRVFLLRFWPDIQMKMMTAFFIREMKTMKYLLKVSAVLIASLCLFSGCHSVTEVSGSVQSSVTFISTSDFTIVDTLEGITDGRSICSINSTLFFVYNAFGRLYRIDSAEMVIDTSFTIDTGTGQPEFGMTSPPPRTSLFVLGSGGQIIQVSIASNSVVGAFSPGPSTVALCSSRSMPNVMIYTVDGQDNYVREIDPSSYDIVRSDVLWLTPSCVTIAYDGDSLLVGSDVGGGYAFVTLNSGTMFARPPVYVGTIINDVIPYPSVDEYYYASLPNWGSGYGQILKIVRPEPPSPDYGIQGNPIKIAADNNGRYVYVLSNTGDATCLVTIIDELYGQGQVIAEIPIDGYPQDMSTHGDEEYLIILTTGSP